jgi:hypothetical protein
MAMAGHQEALERLSTIVGEARQAESRLGFFAALYRQVTVAVIQGIEAGVFDDAARMSRLTGAFASRYFGALDTWQGGGQPSRCWRVAFDTASRRDRLILQHVILGINAHINLDLAVAAAQVQPGSAIQDLRPDFYRVNHTLERVFPVAQDVVAHFSPILGVLDTLGGRTDDQVLNFSIGSARDEAWRQAVVLASLDPEGQGEAISLLDRKVAFLARIVAEPGGILDRAVEVVHFVESDDVVGVIDAFTKVEVPLPPRELSSFPDPGPDSATRPP